MTRYVVALVTAAMLLPLAASARSNPMPKLFMGPARNEIHLTMEKRFGTLPPDLIITMRHCDRRSRTRIRCAIVAWQLGDSRFEGWATVQMRRHGPWQTTYRITHTNEYCVAVGGSGCVTVHRS